MYYLNGESNVTQTQVDTPMGVQPLPQSKPPAQSATDHLVQLSDKPSDGQEQQPNNFG